MVPLALGSQTVGSTLRPASYCGIVGYKPSFGYIDRTGVRTLAETFDTVGVFSRSVPDAAYFVSIISRRPSLCVDDKLSGSPSVGICQTYEWPAADEDARAVFETAAGLIDKAGGHLSEVTLPEEFRHLTDAQALIADFEAANSAAYELHSRRDSVSKSYLERAETGLSYTEKQYDDALSVVTRAQNSFDAVMEGVDVLLCPSATGQAPEGLDATGNPIFNRLGTALKGPCVNIPGLSGHSGLPVGVQLIGRIKDDRKILATADWMHGILQRR